MSSLPYDMLSSIWQVAAALTLKLVWGEFLMLRPAGALWVRSTPAWLL